MIHCLRAGLALAIGATALGFASAPPARAGSPTGVTLGADRTQSPTTFCIVNAGACLANLGTYTAAGVWTPAGALLPGNNLSDIVSQTTARANLGLAAVAASGSAADLGAGTLPAARLPAFTGDATSSTGSAALTLATTGITAGSYGAANTVPVLTVDAKGRITAASTAPTGTVTSVGLSLPSSLFVVSGSPVSGAGTLAAALAAQAANCVLAGPGSGSAAAPTCRSLVNADLPPSAASTIRGNAATSSATPADLTPAQAKALLNYAGAGSNSDITALSGLTTALPVSEGGTGATSAVSALVSLGAAPASNTITCNGGLAGGGALSTNPTCSVASGGVTNGMLANMAAGTVKANLGTGTSAPSDVAPSAVLDAATGTPAQGSVMYRGASGWAALAPGSSGQMLQTNGSGSNPSWVTPALAGGGGNVTATGSPTAGQIAQWTNGTTIQGITTVPASAGGTGAATAAASQFFGGPATGSAAAPGFRALAATDLPAASQMSRTAVADAAYTILATDRLVAVTSLSAARTLTLPAASAYPQGARLLIVDESGKANTYAVTVTPAGSDKINGAAASVSLGVAYGYVALESSGAGWTVTDAAVPTAAEVTAGLGYLPARPVTAFAAGGTTLSDLSVSSSYSQAVTVNFTASSGNALIIGQGSAQNNSSGSGALTVTSYVDIYDNTAAAVAVTGSVTTTTVINGNTGQMPLYPQAVAGGLTIGHSYTARLWFNKSSTAGVVGVYNIEIQGMNL